MMLASPSYSGWQVGGGVGDEGGDRVRYVLGGCGDGDQDAEFVDGLVAGGVVGAEDGVAAVEPVVDGDVVRVDASAEHVLILARK